MFQSVRHDQVEVDNVVDDSVSAERAAALSSHLWSERICWPCRSCDRNLRGLSRFVSHREDFHPEANAIFCPFCERRNFQAKKELRRHVVIEHKVWSYWGAVLYLHFLRHYRNLCLGVLSRAPNSPSVMSELLNSNKLGHDRRDGIFHSMY